MIDHYASTLGAVQLGNDQMVIYPHEALHLISKYFPQNVKYNKYEIRYWTQKSRFGGWADLKNKRRYRTCC